jgi:hypothetical protein
MMTRWPRYCELSLGIWLVASGWVIENSDAAYRIASATAGLLVVALDLHSLIYRSYLYLAGLAVAAAMLAFGYFAAPPEAQGTQNIITAALLLAMFAILPTEATLPPPSWRSFHEDPR